MSVSMYIGVYVIIYLCMYVCMYVRMHAYIRYVLGRTQFMGEKKPQHRV